jgi:hypothetical protein
MVRNKPSLNVLRYQLRHALCRHCRWRPHGSESADANVPRTCEATCSVFRHLPVLARTAYLMDPMLRPPEMTLRHHILDLCRDDPDSTARGMCPLRRYQGDIAKIIAEAYAV